MLMRLQRWMHLQTTRRYSLYGQEVGASRSSSECNNRRLAEQKDDDANDGQLRNAAVGLVAVLLHIQSYQLRGEREGELASRIHTFDAQNRVR